MVKVSLQLASGLWLGLRLSSLFGLGLGLGSGLVFQIWYRSRLG